MIYTCCTSSSVLISLSVSLLPVPESYKYRYIHMNTILSFAIYVQLITTIVLQSAAVVLPRITPLLPSGTLVFSSRWFYRRNIIIISLTHNYRHMYCTKFYTPNIDYKILVLCTCTYLIFLSSLWKLGYMNYKIVLTLKTNHKNQCNTHTYRALPLYHQHLCFFSSYSYLDHHSAYKEKLCIVTYVCVHFI